MQGGTPGRWDARFADCCSGQGKADAKRTRGGRGYMCSTPRVAPRSTLQPGGLASRTCPDPGTSPPGHRTAPGRTTGALLVLWRWRVLVPAVFRVRQRGEQLVRLVQVHERLA